MCRDSNKYISLELIERYARQKYRSMFDLIDCNHQLRFDNSDSALARCDLDNEGTRPFAFQPDRKNQFKILINQYHSELLALKKQQKVSRILKELVPHELAHAIMISEIQYNPKYRFSDIESVAERYDTLDVIYHPRVFQIQIAYGVSESFLNNLFDERNNAISNINDMRKYVSFFKDAVSFLNCKRINEIVEETLPAVLVSDSIELFNLINLASNSIADREASRNYLVEIENFMFDRIEPLFYT